MFRDGNHLHVEAIGSTCLPNNIKLNDILIVPHLTKPLLSVGKLTLDQPLDVLFSQPYFYIYQIEAQNRCLPKVDLKMVFMSLNLVLKPSQRQRIIHVFLLNNGMLAWVMSHMILSRY